MFGHSIAQVYNRLHNRCACSISDIVAQRRSADSLTFFFRRSSIASIMDNNRVNVHVHEGRLIGIVKEAVHDGNYVAFQGIPYAKPPIGELRFKVNAIPS